MLQNDGSAKRAESDGASGEPLPPMRPRWDSGVRALRQLFTSSEFAGLDRLDRDELEDD